MSVTTQTIAKIVSRGLQDVLTQRLNAAQTGYEDIVTKWQGDTSLIFTPKREVTVLPSGNNPSWDSINGPVLGDVELKLYSLPLDTMPELLAVKYSAADGICVGDTEDEAVFLGMSFDQLVKSGAAQSINKTLLYKVRFDLPDINVKTIAEADNAVADVTLKGKAYPVFFTKTNGTQGSRTYSIVNSVSNATKFTANANAIVYPVEMTADTPTPTPDTTAGSGD